MTPVELISLMAAQLEAGDRAVQYRTVPQHYVDRAIEIHTVTMFRVQQEKEPVDLKGRYPQNVAEYAFGIDPELMEKLKNE